jgi:type II secretory pathway component PulF
MQAIEEAKKKEKRKAKIDEVKEFLEPIIMWIGAFVFSIIVWAILIWLL